MPVTQQVAAAAFAHLLPRHVKQFSSLSTTSTLPTLDGLDEQEVSQVLAASIISSIFLGVNSREQVLTPLLEMFSQSEAFVSSATSLVVSRPFLAFPLLQLNHPFLSISVQNARLRGERSAGSVAR